MMDLGDAASWPAAADHGSLEAQLIYFIYAAFEAA
jgi:hypothetical protein